ncbi:MAG: class I SAM-dependent methyltransferase [Gaiellaceae bacterium]
MSDSDSFNELLREADEHPIVGWDFSWLGDRLSSQPLPWDYAAMLLRHARNSPDLLDLGTGGEFLASLEFRPPRTVATEAWPPNVETAGRRLRPLGITVVAVEPAPDNDQQTTEGTPVPLPFPDESFALIASRHTSYVPSEVARVLTPGGVFLTQQMGSDYGEFYDALDLPGPRSKTWNPALAVAQLEQVGLTICNSAEAADATTFADVGALAWFLRAIPWAVKGFSIEEHRPQLERLHRRILSGGPMTIQQPAFWLEAVKKRAVETL